MSIVGFESLVYGVTDVAKSTGFFEDFGLVASDKSGSETIFTLDDASRVILRKADDPTLPKAWLKEESGPREIVWGVDSQASLDALEKKLKAAGMPVKKSDDGSLHTNDPAGIGVGLRVFQPKPIGSDTPVENAPGNVRRLNETRKWYQRARPKVLHHTVFHVPDVDKELDFYVKLLDFRITDISRGFGVFIRCDGRKDHHNIALFAGDKLDFHHASFGVENIDELMVGANHMQRKGWVSHFGIGRHRLSSGIFYFMPSPAGGEAEYFADSDYADDNWVPRLWEPDFGAFQWAGTLQAFLVRDINWREPVPLKKPLPTFKELGAETGPRVRLTETG